MDKKWCVYLHIVHADCGYDKYYVGITSQDINKRWRNGNGYVNSPLFYKAILKYGWNNIEHEILKEELNELEAKSMEKSLIEKYKSNDRKYGYNITSGGDGTVGWHPSDETKKKISDSKRGKYVGEQNPYVKISEDIAKNIIKDLTSNPTVQKMNQFKQHYNTSCYDHCLNVAFYSYIIAKKLGLNYKAVARGAMLHDLFLYDWRNSKKALKLRKLHAFIHPEIALENSLKLFYLTEKEKDIILKHMWPVTIKLPKYPESYIVTFTDKYSTIVESLYYYTDILHTKKFYKYAYIFLSLIVFRII